MLRPFVVDVTEFQRGQEVPGATFDRTSLVNERRWREGIRSLAEDQIKIQAMPFVFEFALWIVAVR